ncbi:proline-specific peptidase, partial [Trametes maxima]
EGEAEFRAPGSGQLLKTWYKVFGDLSARSPSRRPLVVLHGGPGVTHNYLLPIAALAEKYSVPVVFYDQIGNGKSTHLPDKMGDGSFWTEDLFLAQLNGLLEHLGIQDDFDLLGHSWGGMLIARYATSHPPGLKHLVLADTPASMHLWVAAANVLRSRLPPDVQAVLDKHEADGTTDSKEYHDAVNVFYGRHLCRLNPMPEVLAESFAAIEKDPTVYMTMNGPSEFFVTGTLKDWSILDSVGKIDVPTLLLNGRYDEAMDSVVVPYFKGIAKVRWFTFAESSHMPQLEETEKYLERVGEFLTQ